MNMTGRNLGKFLVVPTFVARRLHLCKNATDPSSESWNYLSRRLSCNFSEMIVFTPLRDLFLDLQTCLGTNYIFSVWVLELQPIPDTYELGSWPKPVMKFVYMWSHRSLALLNKGIKLELHLMKQLCVYSFELNFMCWNLERSIWHHKWWNSFNGILSKFKLYKR